MEMYLLVMSFNDENNSDDEEKRRSSLNSKSEKIILTLTFVNGIFKLLNFND